MRIEVTNFRDVLLITPKYHEDIRGSFGESFRLDKFEKFIKRKANFCQENMSHSKKGVIRGLHYQKDLYSQSKLVSVIKGNVLDIIVDIRKGSPDFGKHICIELDEKKSQQIYIPRGFAHGYITLSEKSVFHYKVDNYYKKSSEGNIAFDDPKLKINWRLPKSEWIISRKDQNHPLFDEADIFNYQTNLYD